MDEKKTGTTGGIGIKTMYIPGEKEGVGDKPVGAPEKKGNGNVERTDHWQKTF